VINRRMPSGRRYSRAAHHHRPGGRDNTANHQEERHYARPAAAPTFHALLVRRDRCRSMRRADRLQAGEMEVEAVGFCRPSMSL